MLEKSAILALEDGNLFEGIAIGAKGCSSGEVVFNTAMTGYQEILTDPSYARQIVTLTYPHIGNTGANDEDMESSRAWAAGLVIRDLPLVASNFRCQQTLDGFLQEQGVVAIAEIDTRRLTRLLREKGSLNGCLLSGDEYESGGAERALAAARAFPGLKGMDLAKEVSTREPYPWSQGAWALGSGYQDLGEPRTGESADTRRYRVVAYDFGVKHNILRLLAARGCAVTVVPADTPAREVLDQAPDGVFLSNGPGDPEPCAYAIEAVGEFLDAGMPLFGICLGHQLLGLACGARTVKMPHGHHGANHPVRNLEDGTVLITSQNHGFAVDGESLPETLRCTHRSLFDGSLQGIVHRDKPAFGFQGHPEASPGPHDAAPLFDQFIRLMESHAQA